MLICLGVKCYCQIVQCPYNIDFESGTTNGWQFYNGAPDSAHNFIGNVPGGCCPIVTNNAGLIPTRVQVTSLGSFDPYGGFPMVGQGTHSLMIGNDYVQSEADRATFRFVVPTNIIHYTLEMYYALVLQTGGSSHTNAQQARFNVNIFKITNGFPSSTVPCAQFDVIYGAGLPGFYQSPLALDAWCKNWAIASFDLSAYLGDTIDIDVSVGDCALGGHFGYAYVDFACGNFTILNGYCPNSSTATLVAPSGYLGYNWYSNPNYTGLLGTNDTITIPAPAGPDTCYLVMTPFPGFGCPDTLQSIILPAPLPTANFGFPDNYCIQSVVPFTDSSLSNQLGVGIATWKWNFGDPNANLLNPDTSSLQNPTHYYTAFGSYVVSLIVTTSMGCKADTIFKTIHITQPIPSLPITASPPTKCAGSVITLHWTGGNPLPGYSFVWGLNGGMLTSGGNPNGIPGLGAVNANVIWNNAGTKNVTLIVTPPGGSSVCQALSLLSFVVSPKPPDFNLIGADSICPHQPTTICPIASPKYCNPNYTACTTLTQVDVGTGISNNLGAPSPYIGLHSDGRMQMVFRASELLAAGLAPGKISSLAFFVTNKYSTTTFHDFSIKIGCVSYLSVGNIFDALTPLTLVYQNPLLLTTVGYNTYNFITPYNWDGSSSILLEVCFDGLAPTSNDYVAQMFTPTAQCLFLNKDNDFGCTMTSPNPTISYLRPTVRFGFCPANLPSNAIYTWTTVPPGLWSNLNQCVTVNPANTTSYQCIVSLNGCVTADTFTVTTVAPNTVYAGHDTIVCDHVPIQLHGAVTGLLPPSPLNCGPAISPCNNVHTVSVGTSADSTLYPTPYLTFEDGRMLMSFTRTELAAAGQTAAGTISSIAFKVVQKYTSQPFSNFTISMGCKNPNSSLPGLFPTNLTPVYGPNLVYTNLGWNTYPLNVPFNWDGLSDLVVEICYDNATQGASDIVEKSFTNQPSIMWTANNGGYAGCNMLMNTPGSLNSIAGYLRPNVQFDFCTADTTTFNIYWTSLNTAAGQILSGANTTTPMVQVTTTTDFLMQLQGYLPCPVFDTVTVTYQPPPVLISSNDTSVCRGTQAQLDVIGGGSLTYHWTSAQGSALSCSACSSPLATPWVSDTFFVTCGYAACAGFDTVAVTALPVPDDTFTLQTPVCKSHPSLISFAGTTLPGTVYNWNFNGGTVISGSGAGPYQVMWNSSGPKTVTLTTTLGPCSNIRTDTVWVLDSLTSSFLYDNNICGLDSVLLIYTGTSPAIGNLIWNYSPASPAGGNGFDSLYVIYPAAGGNFNLTLSVNLFGCISPTTTHPITILESPISSFFFTKDTLCWGDSATIIFNGQYDLNGGPVTYNWNFNGGTATNLGSTPMGPYKVHWASPGMKDISLSMSQGGCTSPLFKDSLLLSPALSASVALSPNSIVCVGATAHAVVSGPMVPNSNYIWSVSNASVTTGLGTNSIFMNCNHQGMVYVNVQQEINGCYSNMARDSVRVVNVPTSNILFQDTDVCAGNPITITYVGSYDTLSNILPIFNWQWGGNAIVFKDTLLFETYHVKWNNTTSQTLVQYVSLQVIQYGCASTLNTQQINVHPVTKPLLLVSPHTTCPGDSIMIHALSSTLNSNGGPVTYNWWFTGGNYVPPINPAGVYHVSWSNTTGVKELKFITLQISQDNCSSQMIYDSVFVYPRPTASFSLNPNHICSENVTEFIYNGTYNTFGGAPLFIWNYNGGNPNVAGSTPGPVEVTYQNHTSSSHTLYPTLAVYQDGCYSNLFTDTLIVDPSPYLNITGAHDFCYGDSITLKATPGFTRYEWSNGVTLDSTKIFEEGTYFVEAYNSNNCMVTKSSTVYLYPKPLADAGPNQTTYSGNSVTLNGYGSKGGDVFYWTPTNLLSDSTSPTPYALPAQTTTFTLRYSNSLTGCFSTDTIVVATLECEELFIPNAFTPNADGADDYFMIANPKAIYKLLRLEVYDRWGNLIYGTVDKNAKGWDGRYNGIDAEVGTYVYYILYECGGGKRMEKKGDVTLLR